MIKRNSKLIILLFTTLLTLCACLPKQQQLEVQTYLLSVPQSSKQPQDLASTTEKKVKSVAVTTVSEVASHSQTKPTIKIVTFSATQPFDSIFFIFKLKPTNYQQDYYHRFLSEPTVQLKAIMMDILRATGKFSQVIDNNDPTESNYQAQFTLRQLYIDVSDARQPLAVISLELELTKPASSGSNAPFLVNKIYTEKVPITNSRAGAQQIVLAWDVGLAKIIKQMNDEWNKLK